MPSRSARQVEVATLWAFASLVPAAIKMLFAVSKTSDRLMVVSVVDVMVAFRLFPRYEPEWLKRRMMSRGTFAQSIRLNFWLQQDDQKFASAKLRGQPALASSGPM